MKRKAELGDRETVHAWQSFDFEIFFLSSARVLKNKCL